MENTYKDLEEKARKRLYATLDCGKYVEAKNLSLTLINLIKAERMNNSLNRINMKKS